MSVLRNNLTKWNRCVPYVAPDAFRPMIEEFNEEVYGAGGFKVFVPHSGEQFYAEVKLGQGGDSEKSISDVGCMRTAGQIIRSTNDRFVLWHEMCHCLGFEHEQLHAKYPWDSSDNPVPANQYRPREPTSLKTAQNKTIGNTLCAFYDEDTALGHAIAGLGGGSASTGRANLKPTSVMHFHEALPIESDIQAGKLLHGHRPLKAARDIRTTGFMEARCKPVQSLGECDYDSIMMYKAYVAAGIAAYIETGNSKHLPYTSGKVGKYLLLSNDDVRTIRELYPG